MKKWIFTIVMAMMSWGVVNAQIEYEDILIIADFEGDPDDFNYSIGGWGYEALEVVDNPHAEGENTSEKVVMQDREPGSWNNGVDIMFFDAVELGDRNTLRVKLYAETDFYLYMRPLNEDGEPLGEGWAAAPAPGGEWSYGALNIDGLDEIWGVRLEFSADWGNTGEDDNTVVYFDDIEISKAVIPMFEPDRIYVAEATTEDIVIDGFDMEDNWLDAVSTPIENVNFVVDGEEAVPANGSNFRALYDEEFLYLFVEVTDNSPTPPPSGGTDWWFYDNVEFFIDGQGRNAQGPRLNGQYQIRINYGSDQLTGQDGATVDLFMNNGLEWAQGVMVGGYTIEIKMPWLAIFDGDADAVAAIGNGFLVTFDLAIADMDPGIQATRYCNVIWAGVDGSHHPYESSQYWGAIMSEGFTSTEEVAFNHASLKVFPSPARDYIHIEMANLHYYDVYSITGAKMISGYAASNLVRLDVGSFHPGIYLVRAFDKNGNERVSRIVKN